MRDEKKIDPKRELSDEELWFSASVADDSYEYDVDSAYIRFLKRTEKSDRHSLRLRKVWYYAAAVALLLVVSVVSYYQGGRQLKNHFSDIVVEAPLGAKTKMTLPDGTVVWLNAGSKMVYSQGFGVVDRYLCFDGEGYFEVEKNEQFPFRIHTQDLDLTVLGTKFNFCNYAEDDLAVVDLLEGKVALENQVKDMDICYLFPEEKMILNKVTGEMDIVRAEVEAAKAWTSDLLFFDEVPLAQIAEKLERFYDVKIEIASPELAEMCFYAQFDRKSQGIKEVLEILASTGKLSYELDGKTIVLK